MEFTMSVSVCRLRCCYCGDTFKRRRAAFNRHLRRITGSIKSKLESIFCSLECSGQNTSDSKDVMCKYIKRSKERVLRDSNNVTGHDIDREYLWEVYNAQKGRCPISHLEIKPVYKADNLSTSASLDRKDNSKGYIRGNVQFTSMGINFAKNCFTDEQVKQLCRDIAISMFTHDPDVRAECLALASQLQDQPEVSPYT
jgi:hypothetical protein